MKFRTMNNKQLRDQFQLKLGTMKNKLPIKNNEDSASNVDFEVQKGKSVPPADDTDQNGTSSDSNAEDSAVDIDSEPDNRYCSCGTSLQLLIQ